ncbi:4-hydroxy-tetrahydrodipicolinate reductase [Alkalitalea saponilacus]|uniref:4-hydroxy-tetrahydrodipicolinate reductase n=1 Tax=Alkalitalea saponilacus TaxID=889453 RepID=A0A1T5H4Y9_9BACT|nr:4-hydroxy-tetrahydrodipicolinate reductase [Alkalitalea saponilacus]ASB50882.1 4-hydroxy-tetrahydrodipicolinate reductase [Alkalitalea saponilacus]SKC15738.1 dihydrodipicolinate reductase [Alkalitalea saponilacus]
MRIALIGYGKMGKTIEKIAESRGHEVVARIDPFSGEDFSAPGLPTADVAIEFTMPDAAYNNYMECFKHNVPVVSGTTGWLDKLPAIKEKCKNEGQTFFYASNFSVGVNIFFELNRHLAKLMNTQDSYNVEMTEVHHTQKLDAPSGTAISLAEDIIENIDRKKKWELDQQTSNDAIKIKAEREGDVPGIHTIKYESEVDEIIIHHSAKTRQGFALGAVLAAEFAAKNKGFLTMKDMLKF